MSSSSSSTRSCSTRGCRDPRRRSRVARLALYGRAFPQPGPRAVHSSAASAARAPWTPCRPRRSPRRPAGRSPPARAAPTSRLGLLDQGVSLTAWTRAATCGPKRSSSSPASVYVLSARRGARRSPRPRPGSPQARARPPPRAGAARTARARRRAAGRRAARAANSSAARVRGRPSAKDGSSPAKKAVAMWEESLESAGFLNGEASANTRVFCLRYAFLTMKLSSVFPA